MLQLLSSGESMENALRACCKGIKIGKILIHREGDNGQQVWFIRLLPHVLGWVKLLRSKSLCSSSIRIYPKILQIGMFCFWTPYWEQVCCAFLHTYALDYTTFHWTEIIKISTACSPLCSWVPFCQCIPLPECFVFKSH